MNRDRLASRNPWRPFSQREIESFIKDNQVELNNPYVSWEIKRRVASENVMWHRLLALQEEQGMLVQN